jgi:hypothetical protein
MIARLATPILTSEDGQVTWDTPSGKLEPGCLYYELRGEYEHYCSGRWTNCDQRHLFGTSTLGPATAGHRRTSLTAAGFATASRPWSMSTRPARPAPRAPGRSSPETGTDSCTTGSSRHDRSLNHDEHDVQTCVVTSCSSQRVWMASTSASVLISKKRLLSTRNGCIIRLSTLEAGSSSPLMGRAGTS